MALRLSGRFIVTQAMPSSNSTSTVLPPGTGADVWAPTELVVTGSLSLLTRKGSNCELGRQGKRPRWIGCITIVLTSPFRRRCPQAERPFGPLTDPYGI